MDILALGSMNQKNFEVNKKSQALKVRKTLTANFMNSNTKLTHFFHFRTEIHDLYYYITVNVTILCYSYTCVQYLDVQTK